MSTTERGRQAEALAASYLEARDLEIIARNWRTRYCEIDLVAYDGRTVHIVEIKYRATASYGDGFDFVTRDKQTRLVRAAAAWCQQKRYTGPYQIDVVSVLGDLDRHPSIEWLENAVTA